MEIARNLHDYLLENADEMTQKWLDTRLSSDSSLYSSKAPNQDLEIIREQNIRFIKVLSSSLIEETNKQYIEWVKEVSLHRAKSQIALHISLGNFKKFRFIFWDCILRFAEENNISASELG